MELVSEVYQVHLKLNFPFLRETRLDIPSLQLATKIVLFPVC